MPKSSETATARSAPTTVVREALLTGVAVVVPIAVTTLIFATVASSLYRYLALLSGVLPVSQQVAVLPGVLSVRAELLVELATPVVLLCVVFVVGLVVDRSQYGETAVDYFDAAATRVPGFGSVYESFRQMSDVVLSSDTESFREVKLVEFPHEGSYTLGFVTTETPDAVSEPTPHDEMVTMFLPMAPNPVMGGHLVHLPTERVMDVDLTVEEGIQTIVTSGVAIADSGLESGLSDGQLNALADQAVVGSRTRNTESGPDQTARYEASLDPEFARRPQRLAERERSDGTDPDATRPAQEADRPPEAREKTEGRPAEHADRPPEARAETAGRPTEHEDDPERET